MNIAEELEKLQQLHQSGGLTDEEYAKAKAALLNAPPPQPPPIIIKDDAGTETQTRQWAMFLHFSMLAGIAIALFGWIVPIVIWQVKKDELPRLDAHGRIAVNWMISTVLYGAISALLCIVLIGFPMLIALGIACIVFPVIAGIKANNGEIWRYPLSIEFLK